MMQIVNKYNQRIWLVPMGSGGYGIKSMKANQSLGDTLDGEHYYTPDYEDIGKLASDIVTRKAQWIAAEPNLR